MLSWICPDCGCDCAPSDSECPECADLVHAGMLSLAAAVKAELGTLPSEIPLQARVFQPAPELSVRKFPLRRSPRLALHPEAIEDPAPLLPWDGLALDCGAFPFGALSGGRPPIFLPETPATLIVVPEPRPESEAAPQPALPCDGILPPWQPVWAPAIDLEPPRVAPAHVEPTCIEPVVEQLLLLSAPKEPLLLAAPSPLVMEPEPLSVVEPEPEPELLAIVEPEPVLAFEPEPPPVVEPRPESEPEPEPAPAVTSLQNWTPPPPVARPLAPAPPPVTIDATAEVALTPTVALPRTPEIVQTDDPMSVTQKLPIPVIGPIKPSGPWRPVIPGWLISLVVATALSLGGAVVVRNMDRAHKAAAPVQVPVADAPAQPQDAFAGYIEVTGLRMIADLKNGSRLHYVVVNHSAAQIANAQLQILVRSGAAPPGPDAAKPLFSVSALITGLAPYESRDMTADIENLNTKEIPDWQFLKPEVRLISQQ